MLDRKFTHRPSSDKWRIHCSTWTIITKCGRPVFQLADQDSQCRTYLSKLWNIFWIDNYLLQNSSLLVVPDSNNSLQFRFLCQVIATSVAGNFCKTFWSFSCSERSFLFLDDIQADGQVCSNGCLIDKQNGFLCKRRMFGQVLTLWRFTFGFISTWMF